MLRLLPLAALLAPPSAGQAPPPPAVPPGVEGVLRTDSLVVDSLAWGEGRSVWPYAFVETDSRGETWAQLRDPYGGSFFGPLTMVAAMGEEAVAYAEGRGVRSVLFLPRSLTLTALGLICVGVVAGSALPFVWYRRRYWKERARRRAAEDGRRHLAEGREAERVRTAQDLHDGPLQDLHALRMHLALLARGADDGRRVALGEAADEAQRVVTELRRVAEDLRPPALGPFGLAAALRAFVDRSAGRHVDTRVALDLDDDGQALPGPVRLALFRIAQEAVTNAAKHAAASTIRVVLRLGPDAVTLSVEDDGSGYAVPDDLSAPTAPGHYGLVGMAERAEAIGAALAVESRPGGGTRVHVEVAR